MFPLIRNIVIIFLLLTIVYAVLSFVSRMKERARLAADYELQSDLKKTTIEKDIFIAAGMKKYGRSYKPKLILGVYVIPGAIMSFLVYLAQYT